VHKAVAVDVAAEDDVLNVVALVRTASLAPGPVPSPRPPAYASRAVQQANRYAAEAEELCKHAQVEAVSQEVRRPTTLFPPRPCDTSTHPLAAADASPLPLTRTETCWWAT
jgi:hypothetical protein